MSDMCERHSRLLHIRLAVLARLRVSVLAARLPHLLGIWVKFAVLAIWTRPGTAPSRTRTILRREMYKLTLLETSPVKFLKKIRDSLHRDELV